MPWDSADGDGVRFVRDGDRLRVAERGELLAARARRALARAAAARDAASSSCTCEPTTRDPFDCVSKGLTFSVR